jgi:hypothetical protein
LRGNYERCKAAECGKHEDWVCVEHKKEITRLTGFLERIRDGKICRRCIKENANGYILMNDEDGSPHDCAREIAREALKECK